MAHVIKAIKPSRLKVDGLRLRLLTIMHQVEREMKADFQSTTDTWADKPLFQSMVAMAPNGPEVMVWTDDPIYGYVNDGTGEHIITPKIAGGFLAFKWDGYGTYKAKTTPGVLGSVQSVLPQNDVAFAAVVHPGTEARKFDELITKLWLPKFKIYCQQALSQFRQDSGHGVK
jgi:hypothetical protein